MSNVSDRLGMQETESGLLIPKGTIEKTATAWGYDEYKMVHRAQKAMSKMEPPVHIVLYCSKCEKQIHSEMNQITSEHELVCDCTVRRVV